MSDCFQCSHRNWRSRVDPDLIGCECRSRAVDYKRVAIGSCVFFRQATRRELDAKRYFDNPARIGEEGGGHADA